MATSEYVWQLLMQEGTTNAHLVLPHACIGVFRGQELEQRMSIAHTQRLVKRQLSILCLALQTRRVRIDQDLNNL
jgi:hypothetical protein